MVRPFDHAVLPVETLEAARARLVALGFTVAGDAVHPFGTENACVFFADNTYLEPLAIAQREDWERTGAKGNQFTARDLAYRFRCGENGFSALAFGTEQADADHAHFKNAGISAGRKLFFGRTITDSAGNKARASFKLAFCADLRAPDFFAFTCQRLNVPKIDRSSLQAHANGVTGIKEIILAEANPSDFQYYLQEVVDNRETDAHSFGIELQTPTANINVMTPEAISAYFGQTVETGQRGLRAVGIVFKVPSFSRLDALAAGAGVELTRIHQYRVAATGIGQGAFFAFEETI